MKPIRKILVPVDYSPHSKEAIRAAADLAGRYEAAITIAHVFEILTGMEATLAYSLPEGYMLFTPQQIEDLIREYEKLLEGAKRDAEAAGARNVQTNNEVQVPSAGRSTLGGRGCRPEMWRRQRRRRGEDYAVDGQNALVLQTNDPGEFGMLYRRMGAAPAHLRRLREAGVATAREYAWSRVVDRTLLPRLD